MGNYHAGFLEGSPLATVAAYSAGCSNVASLFDRFEAVPPRMQLLVAFFSSTLTLFESLNPRFKLFLFTLYTLIKLYT